MMEIIYIAKIFIYIIMCLVLYRLCKRSYKKTGKQISWAVLMLAAFFFSLYSILITNPNLNDAGDRSNYYRSYEGGWDVTAASPGLNWLYEQLRPISVEADFLWFATSFLTTIITLFAFKYYKQANTKVLLFVFFSNYFIYGYSAIKQSFSNAFACILFMLYFNMPFLRKKKDKILVYITIPLIIAVSILFHEASLILLILVIGLSVWENAFARKIGWILMIVFVVIFPYIVDMLYSNIGEISENLEDQTSQYAENSSSLSGNILKLLKGVPFYIITTIGFLKHKVLATKIVNYDRYLFLSAVVSIVFFLSIFNTWYFRFGMFVYMPVFVLAANIYDKSIIGNSSRSWLRVSLFILAFFSLRSLTLYYFVFGGI